MFGYNYKIRPVDVEKGIVKLTPTMGTYVKAFAPSLVLVAVSWLILNAMDNEPIEFDFDNNDDSNE